jgi:membrane protease YdiL (CAAX protease family)
MLFLLKRKVSSSLIGLGVLAVLGLVLRHFNPTPTPLLFSWDRLGTAIAVLALVVCSDGLLHGGLWLCFGRSYLARYHELAAVFRHQTYGAMVCGALMAGIGEELVFRGQGRSPALLFPAAIVFGLLHHIRRNLWPFTLWSIWEGMLFAFALLWCGQLLPLMVAHFLHDLGGFLVFGHVNHTSGRRE